MTDSLNSGDYVYHPIIEGVRGMVLWIEDGTAYVCWETGYQPYEPHHPEELEKANTLDLIISGREFKFEHRPSRSRCKCGLNLSWAKARKALVCSRCHVYYHTDGTPFHQSPPEDSSGPKNLRRIRRRRI